MAAGKNGGPVMNLPVTLPALPVIEPCRDTHYNGSLSHNLLWVAT